MLLTAQSNFYQYRILNPIGGAKTTGNTGFVRTTGLVASYSSITWSLSGTLAACTVQVDYSNDGSTVAGQLIAAQTCTSSGTHIASSTSTPSFVRVSYVIGSGGGTLSFTVYGCNNSTCTSGGATVTPGGPNKAIQVNDNGTFYGSSNFIWDNISKLFEIQDGGQFTAQGSTYGGSGVDASILVNQNSTSAEGMVVDVNNNANTVTDLIGLWLDGNGGGGTTTNNYGIKIADQHGVGTNNYGLEIDNQGTGSNDYAIKVLGGQNDLGPQTTTVGNLIDLGLTASQPIICTNGSKQLTTSGCASAGSGFTGTLSNNKITKSTGGTGLADSSQTDDGIHAVASPNGTGLQTAGGLTIDRVNDTGTGTGANLFACKSATAGSVVTCATSTKTGVQGVAIAGVGTAPGTTGSTSMCITGNCSVITDNTTVIGHYGIPSTTTIGRIHDTGAVIPTANIDSFLITSVGTVGTAVGVELSTPDWFTAQAAAKVYQFQVNGGTVFPAGDKINANSTTPAAGANTVNIPITTSTSGTTDSFAVNASTTGTGSTFAMAASPTFTGTPAAPTPAASSNTTTLATTSYVTNAIAQGNPAIAVLAASTANIAGTYTAVGAGIGDTFTVTATGAFTLDGIAINTIGQRILLKDQTDATQNGVYTATVVGITAVSPIFTRALDYDQPADINYTAAIQVQSGTANGLSSWLLTTQITSVGPAGSNISYSQFSKYPVTSGALVQLESHTASGGSTMTFTTCLSNSYQEFEIHFRDLSPSSVTGVTLEAQFSTNGGTSYDSTIANYVWGTHYTGFNATGGDSAQYTSNTLTGIGIGPMSVLSSNSAYGGASGKVSIFNVNSTTHYKQLTWQLYAGSVSSNANYTGVGGGAYLSLSAVNAFQLIFSGGNLASGTVVCYGVTP